MSTYEALTGEHEMLLAADSEAGKCLIARITVYDSWGETDTYVVRRADRESEHQSLYDACREYDRA